MPPIVRLIILLVLFLAMIGVAIWLLVTVLRMFRQPRR